MNANDASNATEFPSETKTTEAHVREAEPKEAERTVEDAYRVVDCDEHGKHCRYLESDFKARIHREEEQKALAEFMARANAD